MRHIKLATHARCICAFMVLLTSLVGVVPTWAQSAPRTLLRIDTEKGATGPEIHIVFDQQVTYISHVTAERGRVLEITVQTTSAVAAQSRTGDALSDDARETLRWDPSTAIPLEEVDLNNEAGMSRLIVRFRTRVKATARGGKDFRSIVVSLEDKPAEKPSTPRLPPPRIPPTAKLLPPPNADRLGALYEEGRQALTDGKTSRAIQVFTKLTGYSEHTYRRDALELLGLARERNGQLAHARAEYERYLTTYPEGEGSERVQQRLAGLVTRRRDETGKLRPAKARKERSDWELFGSFSQFHRYDEASTDLAGQVFELSTLSSDVYLAARRRGDVYDLRTQLTAGVVQDFGALGEDDGRISEAYVEGKHHSRGMVGRVGRQSRNTSGILGRFDGGILSYDLSQSATLNLNLGFPVDASTIDRLDTDRFLYGVSLDLGTFAEEWDFNLFAVEQRAHGLLDRQAVGGEVRYFSRGRSLFTLLDYDTSYSEVNIALVLANATLTENTSVHMSADKRKSPTLTTSNALIGQLGVIALDDLSVVFTEDEIRQLALDRTAESRSLSLGASHTLSEQYQANIDVTMSSITETPASGGVEATPAAGDDLFYDLQLIATSLFKTGDITIFGLRFQDTTTSDLISASINSRYPITQKLRFNPRLQLNLRPATTTVDRRFAVRPSFRLEYRWTRAFRIELETGGEFADESTAGQSDNLTSYFASFGYRWDF